MLVPGLRVRPNLRACLPEGYVDIVIWETAGRSLAMICLWSSLPGRQTPGKARRMSVRRSLSLQVLFEQLAWVANWDVSERLPILLVPSRSSRPRMQVTSTGRIM